MTFLLDALSSPRRSRPESECGMGDAMSLWRKSLAGMAWTAS